ncbi:FecR family protein [Pedobacter agri]|uniref:FecR family protein n=1 Tax=Pedobacter agri TaxID=454586 RepID=UPI00278AD4C3|nr:FecR family protein [Pedobacter agri]MDQ1139874.1 transmembrane sensor [Pedobacter agri]
MKKDQFKILIDKYLQNQATEDEVSLIDKYYDKLSGRTENEAYPHDTVSEQALLSKINHEIDAIEESKASTQKQTVKLFPNWLKIASVLAIISLAYYFFQEKNLKVQQGAVDYASKILPGGNKAILRLGNGKSIDLTAVRTGKLTAFGSSSASKIQVDEVSFADGIAETSGPQQLNVIEVPVGGFFKVVLSDGTKVWLNSASSLTFPSDFIGPQRNVKLTGEGYFEVAHQAQKPFVVETNKQSVEVLGTHFNINAYADEDQVKTTLLTGSVKVRTPNKMQSALLKPGEAAILTDKSLSVHQADVNQSIDWINGRFNFSHTDVKSVLRKIARWYDIEVSYEGDFTGVEFGGKISKKKNLKETLNMLSRTGDVKFKVTGRRVVVMP